MSSYGIEKINVIPSGSIALDAALGRGGWPRGRLIEVFSETESAGKTTICLEAIKNAQQLGLNCAFIDTEHALDARYARSLGVNLDELFFCQPQSGDEAVEMAEKVCRSGEIQLCVFDSIYSARPKSEIEGEVDDANISYHARLVGQLVKRTSPLVSLNDICFMMTNQSREKPGIAYGNPKYQPGGNGPKFYCSIRVSLKRLGKPVEDANDVKVANEVCAVVVKNKIAPPWREAEFKITYGKGIERATDVFNACVKAGFIFKKGSWWFKKTSTGEERICQGEDKATAWVEQRIDAISEKIKQSPWWKQEVGIV